MFDSFESTQKLKINSIFLIHFFQNLCFLTGFGGGGGFRGRGGGGFRGGY